MASIRLRFLNGNNDIVKTTHLVGRKMTPTWMKEHYGRDWREQYEEMYSVHNNEFGIGWVFTCKGRTCDYAEICTTKKGTEPLPTYTRVIYETY